MVPTAVPAKQTWRFAQFGNVTMAFKNKIFVGEYVCPPAIFESLKKFAEVSDFSSPMRFKAK